jgi:hypothetical protein
MSDELQALLVLGGIYTVAFWSIVIGVAWLKRHCK